MIVLRSSKIRSNHSSSSTRKTHTSWSRVKYHSMEKISKLGWRRKGGSYKEVKKEKSNSNFNPPSPRMNSFLSNPSRLSTKRFKSLLLFFPLNLYRSLSLSLPHSSTWTLIACKEVGQSYECEDRHTDRFSSSVTRRRAAKVPLFENT